MPNHTHKSAAVPFVNQKGERSMKRVKVPRYFAGKRPAYANEKDDDEEEYITDDEDEEYDEEQEDEEEDNYQVATASRKLDHFGQNSDDEDDDEDDDNDRAQHRLIPCDTANRPGHDTVIVGTSHEDHVNNYSDEEDDDPRFRRLKQIAAKYNPEDLLNLQMSQLMSSRHGTSNRNVIVEEDSDEETVIQRHAIARQRKLEEPTGIQAILGGLVGSDRLQDLGNKEEDEEEDDDELTRQPKRLDTDDILKDLKLTGITRPLRERHKTEEEQEAEQRRLKEMLELAKQEATLTSQTYKKVEEDIRKELEREALAKGDIGAREMSSVVTDDEDEELAYEEWKLREIKRVQRDRSERLLLATKAR